MSPSQMAGGIRMNYNEEFDKEMKKYGINGGQIVTIPDEDKATPKDYAKFEAKLALRTRKNEIMLEESVKNAEKSFLG